MPLESIAERKPRVRVRHDAKRLGSEHSARYLLSHRRLLFRVTRNELAARYAGSLLGPGWVLLAPVLVMAVYAAVYLVIFSLSVPGLSSTEYVLYIFSGLVPFFAASEALTLGVGSIVANRSLLSNVVFPIDLIPVRSVLTAQATMVVGAAILLPGTAATGRLSWMALLVPLVWALNVLWLVGVTWILSLLNIVFRDLQHLITAVLMLLLIASPIAYTPSMVPDELEFFVAANPFAYFVIAYQKLWLLGELPSALKSIALVVLSLGTFALGGWFFGRAKKVLVDYV